MVTLSASNWVTPNPAMTTCLKQNQMLLRLQLLSANHTCTTPGTTSPIDNERSLPRSMPVVCTAAALERGGPCWAKSPAPHPWHIERIKARTWFVVFLGTTHVVIPAACTTARCIVATTTSQPSTWGDAQRNRAAQQHVPGKHRRLDIQT